MQPSSGTTHECSERMTKRRERGETVASTTKSVELAQQPYKEAKPLGIQIETMGFAHCEANSNVSK